MITNEREYRITRHWLAGFERTATTPVAEERTDAHPRIRQAMREAAESEAEVLRDQVRRYEQLRDGEITSWEAESLRELPHVLKEARVAAGLTQRELAQRLGTAAQQVQRWEASDYRGVGLDRVQDVADALGLQIRETIAYAARAGC